MVNYLIFREKILNFPPNHSNGRHFFREKKSKSLIQQGFYIYSANPNYASLRPKATFNCQF
ncbi:hypothetical protein [Microcystis sp. M53602_WE12]|uniref:hypothetical protein n=1 Tax=Microcystis sp. M53602_WE12 TaxID=3030674 RepID=UPI0025906EC7|nr:hypothetical protein [Microcystis sp. M53602_WE12]MDJ0602750.1 hypothetical protein [Microcystis sp. M53602_WE12]